MTRRGNNLLPAHALPGRGLWVLAAALVLSVGAGAATGQPAGAPEGKDEFGEFRRVQGVGVLTLWGTPYQRGLAHGRLVSQGVLDMVDRLCGSNLLIRREGDYDRVVLPLMARFHFEPDDEDELRGILDGVKERLGDKAVLRRLKRPLSIPDLKAYNTAGDWRRHACSSFAAWGTLTKDGHTWVGRNFDYLPAPEYYPNQMIVVQRAAAGKEAWAGVGVPGLIGCITGLNAKGVFLATHDVHLPVGKPVEGYAPRLLVLRRLMESCSPGALEAQASPILKQRPRMFDSSVLLAGPVQAGSPPAMVFECAAVAKGADGVTVRRCGGDQDAISREAITCTNWYRARPGAPANPADLRYELIRKVLLARATT
ncbi:MAG: C45 family autoproteolytic acyltransferase/hydrolase [Planctomycetota bacterium]|nr:C45 family autoproteolytic acyltransferase/hydrolase [Planctomycetota bacterium]